MASYVTPKKNAAFIFYASLEDQANAGLFKAAPTLAAGDFKVSIDGGSLTNLTDLPTVTPTGGRMVKVTLTASEMNGDNITVVASDASGAEWYDLVVNIQTSARQIDDLAATGADGDTLETLSDQLDGFTGITAQEVRDAMKLAPSAGDPAAGSVDAHLDDILEDTGTTLPGLIAAGTGSGAVSFPVTINDEASNPIDGVEVWISTDSAGASVLAGTLSTDALGLATFMLDAGTYYLWRQKSGYNFTNPVTIVVS